MVITRPCDDNRLQYHPHIYHNFHFHGYRYRHFIAAMLPWRRRRWLWCMGMTKRKSIRCCDVRVSRADCWNSESSCATQRIPTLLPTILFWLFLIFFLYLLYFSFIFLIFVLIFRKQLAHLANTKAAKRSLFYFFNTQSLHLTHLPFSTEVEFRNYLSIRGWGG